MIGRVKRVHPEPAAPASRDLLRQVRRIELRTRGLVNSRFSGEYHSVFKGQGIEFADVREYLPGDDVRTIDWNVTARLGAPYVKRYVEERELTVMLVADGSGSLQWGTRRQLKAELTAEAAATLAMAAVRNNDRVGLLVATDEVELFVPARKGRRHTLRLVRDLLAFQPRSRATDLAAGLDYAVRVAPARSIVFLFSDFRLGEGWEPFARRLTGATARHDVVAVRLTDPADGVLPELGMLRVRDPETGREAVVDSSRASTRQWFRDRADAEADSARRLFRRLRVDEIVLRTDEPPATALLGFFRRRERRLRR